jgi:hypothetical protein
MVALRSELTNANQSGEKVHASQAIEGADEFFNTLYVQRGSWKVGLPAQEKDMSSLGAGNWGSSAGEGYVQRRSWKLGLLPSTANPKKQKPHARFPRAVSDFYPLTSTF